MQTCDLRSMTFGQLEERCNKLSEQLQKTEQQRDEAIREKTVLKTQNAVLQDIHVLGERIVQCTRQTPMHETRRQWMIRKIVEITMTLKKLVNDVCSAIKEGITKACQAMYNAAVTICNFIYDHMSDITAYAGMAAAAAGIVISVVMLVVGVIGGNPTTLDHNPFDQFVRF